MAVPERVDPQTKLTICRGLIKFIEQTEKYRRESEALAKQYARSAFSPRQDFSPEAMLQASRTAINECLSSVGGMPARLDQPDGSSLSVTLTEWHGFDDDLSKHLWKVQPAAPLPAAFVSFTSRELHAEALELLTQDLSE
jgi:hypothetical protein